MRYMVRTNCEFSIVVEADDEDAAVLVADTIDTRDDRWTKAWAPLEAEETDESPTED